MGGATEDIAALGSLTALQVYSPARQGGLEILVGDAIEIHVEDAPLERLNLAGARVLQREEGRGVEADKKRALFWFHKAAEFGDANAEEKLRQLSVEE